MSMFKTSIAVLCFLTLASVCACEASFDMQSTLVFLEKDSHAHTPEIVSTTQASLFYTFDFSIGTHSFLLEAGILIRKQRSTPFFRKLHYSFFTDTLFFSIGKNTFSFGEGSMKNYFFVHIPQEAGKKREATVWHSLLEIPVRQFLFSAGGFCDSDAPDNGALPKWYALWAKAVYSHPIVSAGIETDMVFQPERTEEQQKKAYTFTAAAEVSAVLPYQFKLYTNAQLPVDILNQTIADWGVLAGASKSFVFTAFTLSTIAEAAYSKEGLAYGLFQNAAISDYLQILGGIQGLESQKIIGIMQSEFFIADFKLKLTYATKNLITAASEGKSQAGTPYIGTFPISIRLGGS